MGDGSEGGGGPGARQGRDVPHSHGRVKGHGNTEVLGKLSPNFPAATRAPWADKARLRSRTDLSSPLPERVRDTHSRRETRTRPSVTLPGTSWHPEHLHGVGGTRGRGEPTDNGVPQVAVTQEREDPGSRGAQVREPRDDGNHG